MPVKALLPAARGPLTPQCQPLISLSLPRSCLERVIVLMKLVPRFF